MSDHHLNATPLTPLKRLKEMQGRGFALTEFTQLPALRIPRHMHDAALLVFVLQGHVAETFGRHAYECDSFSLLVRPHGEPHTHHYGQQGAHCLAVEFTPQQQVDNEDMLVRWRALCICARRRFPPWLCGLRASCGGKMKLRR